MVSAMAFRQPYQAMGADRPKGALSESRTLASGPPGDKQSNERPRIPIRKMGKPFFGHHGTKCVRDWPSGQIGELVRHTADVSIPGDAMRGAKLTKALHAQSINKAGSL